MGHKQVLRRVDIQYEFDRLSNQKMEQVYEMLLSRIWQCLSKDRERLAQREKSR